VIDRSDARAERSRLLERARASDWSYCGEPGECTKCNLRFRREIIEPIEESLGCLTPDLRSLRFPDFKKLRSWREHLAEELLSLPLNEFRKLQHWEGHLRMAFFFLRDRELESEILTKWLRDIGDDVEFVDSVIFHLIRRRHTGSSIGSAWIERGIALADSTRNESLVESLVWTVGNSLSSHATLARLATTLSDGSPAIANALKDTSI
jgi:hypothetical protein